jgi:hypothetical protein
MNIRIAVIFLLLIPLLIRATTNKDLENESDTTCCSNSRVLSVKQAILPASLMAYGTLEALVHKDRGILNLAVRHEVVQHNLPKYKIDNYIQYLPAASVYLLNLAGIKGKNNFKDRTFILGIAAIYTAISVNALKYTVRENRPDDSQRNSFPSGHTTVAFMGAEYLWQEYKDVSPWYGIGGYVIAAGTGFFRVYNNKHWIGDVIFGAGLGMLCTKLAYVTYPLLHHRIAAGGKSDASHDVSFYPYFAGQQGGLTVSLQF